VCVLEDQHRFVSAWTRDFTARPTSARSKDVSTGSLPKKGKRSAADQACKGDPEFIRLRRRHSAVESAINALEVPSLDLIGMGHWRRDECVANRDDWRLQAGGGHPYGALEGPR